MKDHGGDYKCKHIAVSKWTIEDHHEKNDYTTLVIGVELNPT